MKSLSTLLLLASLLPFGAAFALTIAERAEDVKPLKEGDRAPAFTVRTVEGRDYRFDPENLEQPTLLITFRGGWCPFCNTHLQELRHVVPELKAQGYEVLFLSADRPEILYASLKEENRDLGYTILSDSKMEASNALGIAHRNTPTSIQRLKEKGLDMEVISGETHHALPAPSVFLIDTEGVIRFAHVDPDYRRRLSADEIRAAAKRVKVSR